MCHCIVFRINPRVNVYHKIPCIALSRDSENRITSEVLSLSFILKIISTGKPGKLCIMSGVYPDLCHYSKKSTIIGSPLKLSINSFWYSSRRFVTLPQWRDLRIYGNPRAVIIELSRFVHLIRRVDDTENPYYL